MRSSGGAVPEFTVRDATFADSLAIGAISVAAQRAAYAGVMTDAYLASLSEMEEAARWGKFIARDPRVLVAEAECAGVAFARWGESLDGDAPPATAELRDLFVLPRVWRRSFGSALLTEAVARMQAAGFRSAVLWVVHGNARARAFYEGRSWRTDGAEQHHDRFRSGALVHVVRYRRML